MKNYEKYADELAKIKKNNIEICSFISTKVLNSNIMCIECKHNKSNCDRQFMLWLLEEYKEPEEPKEPVIDWSKVPVDTPVYAKIDNDDEWYKYYFARTKEDGKARVWRFGYTSRASDSEDDVTACRDIKLAREEDIEKYKVKE